MADLAERFLAEHAEAKRKARTAAEYRRLLDKIILPALAKRKLADLTRADIAKLHHANRASPYQANRLLAVLSKMFNLAERWGLRPDGSNPCRLIEKFAERKRERMLSPVELARLGEALASFDSSPYAVAAVKLLVFTGAARRSTRARVGMDRFRARRGAAARQQDRRQDPAPSAARACGARCAASS
jgi:integrase